MSTHNLIQRHIQLDRPPVKPSSSYWGLQIPEEGSKTAILAIGRYNLIHRCNAFMISTSLSLYRMGYPRVLQGMGRFQRENVKHFHSREVSSWGKIQSLRGATRLFSRNNLDYSQFLVYMLVFCPSFTRRLSHCCIPS